MTEYPADVSTAPPWLRSLYASGYNEAAMKGEPPESADLAGRESMSRGWVDSGGILETIDAD